MISTARRQAARVAPPKDHRLAWAFGLFALFSLAGALSPAAKALVVLYPAGAFFIAMLAYRRSKPAYLSFVCWLWFVSPCVRRMVDYHSGGTTSPVLLASFFACCVPCFFMVSNWSALLSKRTAPVLYILAGIFYGSFVALMHYRFVPLATALLAWLSPLFIALFLYWEREDYRALYRSLEKTFLWATLLTGLYGIYQYLVLAPWDAAWMIESDLQSIGQPEPWAVRVFGTMNSPQVFASFLVVGLLIAFRAQGKLRFFAAPAGLAALILTMSRAGWLALIAGTIYLAFYLTNRQRLQLFSVILVCGVLVGAAMQNSAISDTVGKRFQSFSDGKGDDSMSARLADYGTLARMMAEEPFGAGIGNDAAGGNEGPSSSPNGGMASRDSTIITVLLSMGWLGSLTCIIGVVLVAAEVLLGGKQSDPALTAMRAALCALIAESPLNNITAGPVAFLVWCSIGFCLAQRETVDEQARQAVGRVRERFSGRQAVAG